MNHLAPRSIGGVETGATVPAFAGAVGFVKARGALFETKEQKT